MIQNKYHGNCCACGKVVRPFEGFIRRAARGDGWLFKHQACVKGRSEALGIATQPVREPETRVCSQCDRHKPIKEFNGFVRCNKCREMAIGAMKASERMKTLDRQ